MTCLRCPSPRLRGYAICGPCQADEDARNMPPALGPLRLRAESRGPDRAMSRAQAVLAQYQLRRRLPAEGADVELDGEAWQIRRADVAVVELVGERGFRHIRAGRLG